MRLGAGCKASRRLFIRVPGDAFSPRSSHRDRQLADRATPRPRNCVSLFGHEGAGYLFGDLEVLARVVRRGVSGDEGVSSSSGVREWPTSVSLDGLGSFSRG